MSLALGGGTRCPGDLNPNFRPPTGEVAKGAAECPFRGLGFVVIHKPEVPLCGHMCYNPCGCPVSFFQQIVHDAVMLVCGVHRHDFVGLTVVGGVGGRALPPL